MTDTPKVHNPLGRAAQARPRKSEITDAWRRIRAAAADGNLMACGLVIALTDERLRASMSAANLLALAAFDEKRGGAL